MKFLVYSQIRKSDVGANLGRPEYSYFFVLDQFLPALRKIGTVVLLTDPAREADEHLDASRSIGESCVLICFAPPNKSVLDVRCPTITVFAWEFDRLPDELWDDDWRNDWTRVLRRQGRSICLSGHSAVVVRRMLGEEYPVAAIPVPVFDRYHEGACTPRVPLLQRRSITFSGTAYDSQYYVVTASSIENHTPPEKLGLKSWDGQPIELNFCLGHDGGGYLGGFYETEGWGTWSKIENPWILLPAVMHGEFTLTFDAVAYGPNFGKTIVVQIGDCVRELLLDHDTPRRPVTFNVEQPAALIQFRGLDTSSVPGVTDPRTMGIGLRTMRIAAAVTAAPAVAGDIGSAPLVEIELSGVVYVSVLNPGDDRKNWVDILTAFCFAFRETADATLVLKMTHHSIAAFLGTFHYQLQRIGNIKCRIVLLHAFLDEDQYKQLIDASTYYVNASRCEGLCLPLMECMSRGLPAVAPANTAMQDYVTADSVFVVRSTLEPGIWPHDPRNVLRTLRYRIDWSSLKSAFEQSYQVAVHDPDRYARMSAVAVATQQAFSADAVVEAKLRDFFDDELRAEAMVHSS